jgi:peptide subunit release factor 1 (eRF1)
MTTEHSIEAEERGTVIADSEFEGALRQLSLCETDEGILSVYLDIDPATTMREGYEAVLLGLWKPLRAALDDQTLRGRLEYEIAGVTDEVRGWREPPGRSVALFFSGPAGLREVVPLRFPIRSVARFEARPVLSPLIAAAEEHPRFCVVVFDKGQARLITVFLGEVEDEINLRSDVVGRSAVGGWGGYLQSRYARHREQQLVEHARRAAEHIWAMDRSRPIHGLILAGPDEALTVLRQMLPASLERIVIGTTQIEAFAITPDVVRKVEAIERDARETEGRRLIGELVTEAEKGGRATLGWDDTLAALGEARVHVLVLPAEQPRAGVVCPKLHFLAVSPISHCPLCHESLRATEDIAESATRVALLTDTRIHFLAPAASKDFAARGAGAFLRY